MKENKIDWINISKGIAILLVIFEHALFKVGFIGNTILMFHMPFFFFISGYCYSIKKDEDLKKWQISNLIKNIKIYAVFSLFGFAWYMVKEKFNIPFETLSLNFLNIFYANQAKYHLVAGGMWFIVTLFVTKILFSFISKYVDKFNKLKEILFLFILCFIAVFLNMKNVNMLPFCLDNVRFAILFYYLGYLYKKHFSNNKGSILKLILFSILLLSCNYFNPISVMMHENSYGNYLLFFVGSISGILLLINISKLFSNNSNLKNIFTFFGKNTLYYFTMQFVCLDVVKKLFSYFPLPNFISSILVFISVVLLLIPINSILNRKLTPWIETSKK